MNLIIVTPVYNDWESFIRLSHLVHTNLTQNNIELIKFVVVNDGSPCDEDIHKRVPVPVDILHLTVNVGHQRAIAIGLAYVQSSNQNTDFIVVMDCDGEDSPENIPFLCLKSKEENKLIFAERKKRSESLPFKIGYKFYKFIFKILTNETISFGNFSCIPIGNLNKIVRNPNIWNHYSGSIIKSKMPYSSIPTIRAKRLFGKSKMNFQNLIIHGLSSIAVHVEVVVYKIFMISIVTIFSLFLAGIAVICIKYFSSLAIPGWTSGFLLGLLNTGGILFIITLLLFIMQLNQRSSPPINILDFFKNYIDKITTSDGAK